ncbi:MAG: alpha/beta fold hydrolase [Pseudobdellovibrionaceae bacterium]
MPFLKVGEENLSDVEIYYEDHGLGRPVVLIHGWPLNGASWEKQIPELLNAGCRVITYDRRGFGKSSKPAIGYDYDTLSEDLSKLLVHLDLRSVTLVGFSMGTGEIARYLGSFGAKRIEKAIFISGILPCLVRSPNNPQGINSAIFEDIQEKLAKDRFSFFSEFLWNFYNLANLEGKLISKEAVQASWNTASIASPIGSQKCVQSWMTDFRSDLVRVDIPTLIIHGDADQILPIESTAYPLKQALKNTELVVIDQGPHGILWTHADQVNNSLLRFLHGKRITIEPSPALPI